MGEFLPDSRLKLRLLVVTALFADALLGLRYQSGAMNLVDWFVLGNLPNDLVWIVQLLQSISSIFGYVKILFEDIPKGIPRSIGIALSPPLLVIGTLFSLDLLLKGLGESAGFTFDLMSLTTNTIYYSAAYLAIAVGLTLTYKVQRYGNFAQSELFMVGMFTGLVVATSEHYFPIFEVPSDGVISWSLFLQATLLALVITGLAGIMIDRLVYRGFRLKDATPQVMMIASLGVAFILRSVFYLRFSAEAQKYGPDADWKLASQSGGYQSWQLATSKMRVNLGDLSLDEGKTYKQFNCEETIDEATGEAVLSRIVTEGSKPAIELYDVDAWCITDTYNYPFYKGISAVVIFSSVILLLLLLKKTRLGRRMRAVADNPELAASSGLNVERVQMTSAFLAGAICGVGGMLYGITAPVFEPGDAFMLLLPAFAVIVLGTIGSIEGAIVAALMIGAVRAISAPVLIGITSPLRDGGGWAGLADVIPFALIIAVLMVMPEGIGDAWEKWKIDKLRNKRDYDPEKSGQTTAALAILPTGIFGLHHWHRGRTDRATSFSTAAIAAYVLHRIGRFVGNQSFAEEACRGDCAEPLEGMKEELSDLLLITNPTSAEMGRMEDLRLAIDEYSLTNLELLTGRDDGTLMLEDSPFTVEDSPTFILGGPATEEDETWLSEVNESWLDQMQIELDLVNLITDAGDLAWPLVPLLLWAFAAYEGATILRNIGNQTPQSFSLLSIDLKKTLIGPFEETISSLRNTISGAIEGTRSTWHRIDRWHSNLIEQSGLNTATDNLRTSINGLLPETKFAYGRRGRNGSWLAFFILLAIILTFMAWLPISESSQHSLRWSKVFQMSNVLVMVTIFILMSFSLNLHTGVTGMVNFGVIFFVGIGAFTVGILTAADNLNGYGWGFLPATVFAILLAAAFGWALAFPTARLRTDYFAIVTISLGEILRVFSQNDPLLWSGSAFPSFGVFNFPLPLKKWWFCGSGVEIGVGTPYVNADSCRKEYILPDGWDTTLAHPSSSFSNSVGDLMGLGEPAPYALLLAVIGLVCVALVWILLESLMASPWGRILKSIREDEEVAQHHGHDVLNHKAASLALGAAIAALAGALWAWKLTGFEPSFMAPARSTFLVWAAFVIGGVANNRGMVVGAMIIVLMEFVFNVLVAASSPDLPLYESANRIDSLFYWIVTEQWEVTKAFLVITAIGIAIRSQSVFETGLWGTAVFALTAVAMGESTHLFVTNMYGDISISGAPMTFVKMLLIGCLMLFSLKYNPSGLLPEVPSRPERPKWGVEE